MNSLNRYLKLSAIAFSIFLALFINACSDDDPPLPANKAVFETGALGMEDDQTQARIGLSIDRAVETPTNFTVSFTSDGVVYNEHFTTEPAATNNSLTVTIPAGSTSASFNVNRKADLFLEGNEKIVFTISTTAQNVVVGDVAQVSLSFSSIVSDGQQLTLNGLIGAEAGSGAGNSVFVDFSSNLQTAVARASWDIAFYAGDDFRVILNNTNAATVVGVEKNDINTVTVDDVDSDELKIGQGAGTFEIIDDIYGDITKTAIPVVSATDADNKVYVINQKGGSATTSEEADLIKIRVLRSGTGYKLQYAKVSETTFTEVEIPKSATHNFTYFSFTTKAVVPFAPAKQKWDIQWTYSIYYTTSEGVDLPYAFSDMVFINDLDGVSAAEVLTSTVAYADFDAADVAAVTFLNERNVIGSNWRVTSAAPPATAGVKTDRFYVVKDAFDNVYKLKFINFHASDGGTRGKPLIEYALVTKGE